MHIVVEGMFTFKELDVLVNRVRTGVVIIPFWEELGQTPTTISLGARCHFKHSHNLVRGCIAFKHNAASHPHTLIPTKHVESTHMLVHHTTYLDIIERAVPFTDSDSNFSSGISMCNSKQQKFPLPRAPVHPPPPLP